MFSERLTIDKSVISHNRHGVSTLHYNRYLGHDSQIYLRKANESIEIFDSEISSNAEEAFHGLVFRAARNPWLVKIAGELRLMSMLFGPQRAGEGILTASSAAWSWREHTVLARLFARGDASKARRWMQQHIESGRAHVLDWFDRSQANGESA